MSASVAPRVREYGAEGPTAVLLHGGPGGPGYLAPLARALAGRFRILEPFQRGSGGEPLTVARHVADLEQLIATRCAGSTPALVGSSWGAMLALAHAAEHAGRATPLVLVGCGTFDQRARDAMRATLEQRGVAALAPDSPSNEHLADLARQLTPAYSHELISDDLELDHCDARAHRETWDDMLRLQADGVYPAAFASITAPVLMLHGAVDPHPGALVRDSLLPWLPHLEYRELERCGHYPWLERHARDAFLELLGDWLARQV
jgi:pimeloyl-ACP methyl ester carboxylesterase